MVGRCGSRIPCRSSVAGDSGGPGQETKMSILLTPGFSSFFSGSTKHCPGPCVCDFGGSNSWRRIRGLRGNSIHRSEGKVTSL